MDLEGQLRARITELNTQKQNGNNLLQNLSKELILIDGMISEAVNTLNGVLAAKAPKPDENKEPKKRGKKAK